MRDNMLPMEELKNDPCNLIYTYLIAFTAAIGGLLFGFDMAVVSGAIPFFERYFDLSPFELGVAVGNVPFGCIIGASISGILSDRYGRKTVLSAAAVLFFISALLSALPEVLWHFVGARFIGGIAIGMASPVSPVYIAEISPAKMRGGLVTVNQLAITFGMLCAYAADYIFSSMGTQAWRDNYAWRLMFAVEAVPAGIFFVLLFFVPRSPRWLVKQGYIEKAEKILGKIGGKKHAHEEMIIIKDVISHEQSSVAQLFKYPFKVPMMIGIIIMVYSQICGLVAVTNYTPKLLLDLGFESESAAMFGMVVVGVMLFIATIGAMLIIDKFGRKPLLIASAAGVSCSLCLMAVALITNYFSNIFVLMIVLFAIVSYAVGIGPVSWLLISEIFPTQVRGRATAICTVTLWIANFIMVSSYPNLVSWSIISTYIIFALITFLGGCFVIFVIPETKGKTLEEIESSWR
jgi:sugar porter (SP) family MFS transporter